ncbi:MAG: hypothetical protein CMC82_02845 [Flavobacteriaceae bacterium]|nr:hypothetical protein [Flavobacteriaceae bacterium]|tara:strand:- start:936 stop:1442 length:507 start_codon:yes stop_codon:yes gene_type:complete
MIDPSEIDAAVFDFDGVLTDNTVVVSSSGDEFVTCSRSDGLAFEALKKIEIKTLILSTEKNPVVRARAEKLNVEVRQGVVNKLIALHEYCEVENLSTERILYVGNDVNDYDVMNACGITCCPLDAHPTIKMISSVVLSRRGGDSLVRELVEDVLQIDVYKTLYSNLRS